MESKNIVNASKSVFTTEVIEALKKAHADLPARQGRIVTSLDHLAAILSLPKEKQGRTLASIDIEPIDIRRAVFHLQEPPDGISSALMYDNIEITISGEASTVLVRAIELAWSGRRPQPVDNNWIGIAMFITDDCLACHFLKACNTPGIRQMIADLQKLQRNLTGDSA